MAGCDNSFPYTNEDILGGGGGGGIDVRIKSCVGWVGGIFYFIFLKSL